MGALPLFHHAIELGRKLQSSQTGFVHYCFEDPSSRETVPLFENFTFVLALLRMRQGETILEAKELLYRLLSFQTEQGGFPVYLHEYPRVRKPLGNVAFLFPLLYIYEGYRHVLGKETQERLENALGSLHRYLLALAEMPPLLTFQIKAFEARRYGGAKPAVPKLLSSKEYSDLLPAVHFLGEELAVPWHEGTQQFAGPPHHELSDGYTARTTLLGILLKAAPSKEHPILLHTSLLFPTPLALNAPAEQEGFLLVSKENFFLRSLREHSPLAVHSKGFHLVRLVFGEHILAFQETRFQMKSTLLENGLEMRFTYPVWQPKEKHGDMEYSWYLNHKPRVDILLFGKKATVFSLGDPLTITDGKTTFTLVFSKAGGEGRFCGHIGRGNRPAQISKEVEKNYEAFDWEISLRTLEREDSFALKATLHWPQ